MKKRFFIIFITIILVFFTGCKKYPEGPNLSFRSAVKRISGVWDVETFYVNDINLTENFKSNKHYTELVIVTEDCLKPSFLDFDIMEINNGSPYLNYSYYWDFTNDKKNIICEYANECQSIDTLNINFNIDLFIDKIDIEWQILRLTQNELWLKTEYNNNNYLLKSIIKSR